ncbi:methyl-accepting chemotaxis protein [Treponema pallidum]|uniref:methyl-accepting chemotaxis protein n=1 Tax=Treponema pallidum TaxID=160 RepID=UPI0035D4F5AA
MNTEHAVSDFAVLRRAVVMSVAWVPATSLVAYIAGVIDGSMLSALLTSVSFFCALALMLGASLTLYYVLLMSVKKHQNDSAAAEAAFLRYTWISPLPPAVAAVVYPVCAALEVGFSSSHVLLLSYYLSSVGAALCLIPFFHHPFFYTLQEWAHFIPLRETRLGYYSLSREISVVLVSGLFSMFCVGFSSLLLPLHGEQELAHVVITHNLPCASLICVLSVIVMIRIGRHLDLANQGILTFIQNRLSGDASAASMRVVRRNEFGFLTQSLNKMHKSTRFFLIASRGKMARARKIANSFVRNARTSCAAVNEIISQAHKAEDKIKHQSRTIFETQKHVQHIVGNIDRFNGHIGEQVDTVTDAASSVEQMVRNIESVTQVLSDNSNVIETLLLEAKLAQDATIQSADVGREVLHASEALAEAGAVIQHIASQTNLLAMNASIEATYCKESGQGFEVVASEIRRLAEDASKQGKHISAVLRDVKTEIEKVSESALAVQAQFALIFSITTDIKAQEEVISQSMVEQTKDSVHVLHAIQHITEITRTLQENSGAILDNSKHVEEAMLALSRITSEIDSSVSSMHKNSEQVKKYASSITEIGQKNKDSITDLVTELSNMRL